MHVCVHVYVCVCVCVFNVFLSLSKHTDHTLHHLNTSVSHKQSDVFVIAFDYLELDILAEAAPLYRQAREVECQGAYCGLPYYFPVLHFFK